MDGGLIAISSLLLAFALTWLIIESVKSLQTRREILNGRYRTPAQCERALNYFSQRLTHHPRDWEIYIKRGEAFSYLQNHQQAIRDYTQALALHPNDETILMRRGRAHYKQRKYDEAIWDCTRALDMNPHYSPAYLIRGLAYFASDEYERAARDYTRAIEMNPDNPQHYVNRGHYYLRTMDLEKARADWQQSWNLKPDVSTGLMLGWLKLTQSDGQEDTTIACELEKAAKIDPRSAEAYLCLGIACYLRKAYEQAQNKLAKAADASPENAYISFWQGMVLAAQQHNMQADQAFLRTSDLGLPKALWQPMIRLGEQTQTTYWNY
ncbi:MAG TPA: tetratricopeptide repeat protein [Ktedonobacteraceae bacterium]